MRSRWSTREQMPSVYSTIFIKGINYLYDRSCGELSGWMYKVNGEFPGVGCSAEKLENCDIIEWVYTCDLGQDVGDDYMTEQEAGISRRQFRARLEKEDVHEGFRELSSGDAFFCIMCWRCAFPWSALHPGCDRSVSDRQLFTVSGHVAAGESCFRNCGILSLVLFVLHVPGKPAVRP